MQLLGADVPVHVLQGKLHLRVGTSPVVIESIGKVVPFASFVVTENEVPVGTVGVVKFPILIFAVDPFGISAEVTIVIILPETVQEAIETPDIAVQETILNTRLGSLLISILPPEGTLFTKFRVKS